MKEVRYFFAPDAVTADELPEEEAQHAVRVLRLTEGDEIYLMDGKGTFYRAMVTMAHGRRCSYSIVETLPQQPLWNGRVHLAMAPTKMMERVEWMAEKATEIGCDEFSFLLCRFSERKQMREDRVEKTVLSAVKQSRKPWMPQVNALTPFTEFIKTPRQGRKFICHCYDEIPRADLYAILSGTSPDHQPVAPEEEVTVLVGPEGDFALEEVQQAMAEGYVSVSLGNARLRTETAALSAVMMTQLAKRRA